jgi:hypothetical protein
MQNRFLAQIQLVFNLFIRAVLVAILLATTACMSSHEPGANRPPSWDAQRMPSTVFRGPALVRRPVLRLAKTSTPPWQPTTEDTGHSSGPDPGTCEASRSCPAIPK